MFHLMKIWTLISTSLLKYFFLSAKGLQEGYYKFKGTYLHTISLIYLRVMQLQLTNWTSDQLTLLTSKN